MDFLCAPDPVGTSEPPRFNALNRNGAALARLELAAMRYRLAERRRTKRDEALRRRRPRVENTIINLWRRRRDWLREVEEAHPEELADH